jgi:hypothetical protein
MEAGDFRQDIAGDRFCDGKLEQAHGGTMRRVGRWVEAGIGSFSLKLRGGKTILPGRWSRGMLARSEIHGAIR